MNLQLPLDRVHVMAQLGRVLRVHKRPDQAPTDDMEFATDYAQLCGELTPAQFTGAVDAYLKSNSRFFPKPGEILALGRLVQRESGGGGSLEAQYNEWEKNAWQDQTTGRWMPCPVCGSTMSWHVVRITAAGEAVERQMILHNASVHWKAQVGFTMSALPGTGGGKYEHTIIDHRPVDAAPPSVLEGP